MFLSSEQQGPGLRTQESRQTLNTLVGHHQVFLRSHFCHALTRKFRPEIHNFRVPGHAMTLTKSAKNRQQIARKKVRITVSLQHILNVIRILPWSTICWRSCLNLLKFFFFLIETLPGLLSSPAELFLLHACRILAATHCPSV